ASAMAWPMPEVPPVTTTTAPCSPNGSADELIGIIRPQTAGGVMRAANVDLGEDILVAKRLAPGIDVVHHAVDLKIRNHFNDIVGNDQSMRLTRGFKDVRAFGGDPVVFK